MSGEPSIVTVDNRSEVFGEVPCPVDIYDESGKLIATGEAVPISVGFRLENWDNRK